MTTEINRDALSLLAEVLELAPEIRLGQLFAHIGFLGEAHLGKGLGDLEDEEVSALLSRHRDELLARGIVESSQVA